MQPSNSSNQTQKIKINNTLFKTYHKRQSIDNRKMQFTQIFKSTSNQTGKTVAIKLFKKYYCIQKIAHQVKILESLPKSPYIVKYQGVDYDQQSQSYGLFFIYVQNTDILKCQNLTIPQIRHYIRCVLQALKVIHQKNIIHRDVCLENVLYNPKTKQVKLAHWGCAQFYKPKQYYQDQRMQVTRNSRAPEVILQNQKYDHRIDVWCAGGILANLLKIIIQKKLQNQLFVQQNRKRQLLFYVGTQQMKAYIQKYKINQALLSTYKIEGYAKLDTKTYQAGLAAMKIVNFGSVFELPEKMLVLDFQKRITASQALKLNFFKQKL